VIWNIFPLIAGKVIEKFVFMPIFYQQDIDPFTRLGVWKIEEDESFFSSRVPLRQDITHPHKRLQHLAGRWLLQHLFPRFPIDLIRIADTRKPFLEDEAYHFSISHCGGFAAAIASTENRVGVDIEEVTAKIGRIAHKFVGEREVSIVNRELGHGQQSTVHGQPPIGGQNLKLQTSNLKPLTLLWCCKEAVFKWYGKGKVDFREHIHVKSVIEGGAESYNLIVSFDKEEELFLDLRARFFDELCLGYVVT
jgi:phosphopantetheinyl transferase